jgi:hypothetical protein
MSLPEIATVRICPHCGFAHLRPSRAHTLIERLQAWWSGTNWFRCETCRWRGRIRDDWDPETAFPDLPPLKLGRDLDIDVLQQRDEDSLVDLVLGRREALHHTLKVWLDDSRPAPTGWLRVTTVASARRLLEAGLVDEISLDYDLGWCSDCLHRGEHLKNSGLRHCAHVPTGYDLVVWMSDTGHWPRCPPIVHSGNIEGGARMLGVIARRWQGDAVPARPVTLPPSRPSIGHEDSGSVAPLTMCPRCGGPHLYRTHRRSNAERLRTLLTRRFPIRCSACGWMRWAKDPILVRLSSGADVPTSRIEPERLERIDPDQ